MQYPFMLRACISDTLYLINIAYFCVWGMVWGKLAGMVDNINQTGSGISGCENKDAIQGRLLY
jgi:hypothetical protein